MFSLTESKFETISTASVNEHKRRGEKKPTIMKLLEINAKHRRECNEK